MDTKDVKHRRESIFPKPSALPVIYLFDDAQYTCNIT